MAGVACGKSPQTVVLPAASTLDAAVGAASCVATVGSAHCTALGAPKHTTAVCVAGAVEFVPRVNGRSMQTVSTPRMPAKAEGCTGAAGAKGVVSRNHCGSPANIWTQHSTVDATVRKHRFWKSLLAPAT